MATQFTLESYDRDDGDFHIQLQVNGEGDLDHYVDAFKAFLIAAGYHPETADDAIDEIMCEFGSPYNPRHPFFKPEDQT